MLSDSCLAGDNSCGAGKTYSSDNNLSTSKEKKRNSTFTDFFSAKVGHCRLSRTARCVDFIFYLEVISIILRIVVAHQENKWGTYLQECQGFKKKKQTYT